MRKNPFHLLSTNFHFNRNWTEARPIYCYYEGGRDFPFSLSNWIKSDGKTKINRDRLFSILVAKKKKRGTNPVRTRRDRGRPLIRIDCRRGGDFPFFLLLFVLLGVAVACRSHTRQQTTARWGGGKMLPSRAACDTPAGRPRRRRVNLQRRAFFYPRRAVCA